MPRFDNAPRNTHDRALEPVAGVRPGGTVMDIPGGGGAFAQRLVACACGVIAADLVDHGPIDCAD